MTLIEKKKSELDRLNKRSEQALNVVTSTIRQLEDINNSIDVTLSDIQDTKSSLQETEDGLLLTKESNSKIVQRFKALLEG